MGALMVTRLRWTKFPENPVLPGVAETWEAWTADPTVVYRDGVYHLWYTGAGRKPWKIFYASSRDGLRWSKAERPVNEEGHRASVVHHDGLWRMYLTLGGRGSDVHLQVSPRPEGPFRDEGPVLKPDAPWEEGKLWCPDAVYDEDERLWKMWYSAGEVRAGAGWPEPKAIGYAVSPDGRRWTKCTKNPILVPRGDSSWLGRAICTLMVVKREGRYYGFTNGVGDDGHSRIGLTTSADGLRWDLEPDSLILDLGAPGQFDAAHLFAPAAAYGHAGWRLWYNGKCDREGSAVESIGGARGE
jgi:hypothetical protein